MLRVTGTVLDVQRRQGGQGDQAYMYYTASILTGKADIERVKIDPTRYLATLPGEGEQVDLIVTVRAFNGRNGAGLSVQAVEPVEPVKAVAPQERKSA